VISWRGASADIPSLRRFDGPPYPSVVMRDWALVLRPLRAALKLGETARSPRSPRARSIWRYPGGYEVVDLVPSGLAPVARTDGWVGEDGTIGPYRIMGQEVDFSVSSDLHGIPTAKLRYLARIVTPGDYAWEPASIRLAAAPQDAAFTSPSRVTDADR